MALHQQLPIYKVAYDLFNLVTDLVRNMPRDFKQSIGAEINRECLRVVVLIARANSARDKMHYRACASANHPDRGGDAEKMAEYNKAWEQAQKELGNG